MSRSATRAVDGTPRSELGAALASCRGAMVGVGLFSGLSNVLMLTGAFFTAGRYDRVLPSRSVPTLVGLSSLPGPYTFSKVYSMRSEHGSWRVLQLALMKRLAREFTQFSFSLPSRLEHATMACSHCGISTVCGPFFRGRDLLHYSICHGCRSTSGFASLCTFISAQSRLGVRSSWLD